MDMTDAVVDTELGSSAIDLVPETDRFTGTREMRVVVVGQGYVGLPLAVSAARIGHRVVGLDCDMRRVEALAGGRSPVEDISDAQLGLLLGNGSYFPTFRPEDAMGFDVAVIAVGTPLAGGIPDLSQIESAGRTVGQYLRKGALVVLESTSFPGTTRHVLGRVLEEVSGLRMGCDFFLGFSPERIDPGNKVWTLATTPKIVSGIDDHSLQRACDFYAGLVDHIVRVGRCEEAELAKLLENTFRAVNIALVNEMAELAHGTGLDLRVAMDAAATKPFGFMRFHAGPGVGGHCLPIDPTYLSWWAVQTRGRGSRLIDLAAQINSARPAYVVDRIRKYLFKTGRRLCRARILLLGLAYKPGCGDMRESPAVEVARLLTEQGAQVHIVDPFVDPVSVEHLLPDIRLVDASDDELAHAHVVVLLTDHDFDYDRIAEHAEFVLDCRGRMADASNVEQL